MTLRQDILSEVLGSFLFPWYIHLGILGEESLSSISPLAID